MLAAGGGYTGDNISTEGNLPMPVLDMTALDMTALRIPVARQALQLLCRAQPFLLARLAAFNCGAGDLRWALLALVVQALDAASAFCRRQLARWARGVLRRAWQGARFAAELRHADSTVAAGGN